MKALITWVNGHLLLHCNPYLSCMLAPVAFHLPLCRFGHPSINKLMNLQNLSRIDKTGPDTREILKTLKRACEACQRYAQSPLHSNYLLVTTITSTIPCPQIFSILQGRRSLKSNLSRPTFRLHTGWNICHQRYCEKPYPCVTSMFTLVYRTSLHMKLEDTSWYILSSQRRYVPYSHETYCRGVNILHMHFKQRKSLIRRAWNIVRMATLDTDIQAVLQTAVKAVINSVGPNGLVPTSPAFNPVFCSAFSSDFPSLPPNRSIGNQKKRSRPQRSLHLDKCSIR